MNPQAFQFVCKSAPAVEYPPSLGVIRRRVAPAGEGRTYGDELRRAYLDARTQRGIICLEGDIALSLESWQELRAAALAHAGEVVAVPYPIYPAGTGMRGAVWAHRRMGDRDGFDYVPLSLPCPVAPAAFGLGATFLPARLLDALPDDLSNWDWPRLDTQLSKLAAMLPISVRTTRTPAVHLNY